MAIAFGVAASNTGAAPSTIVVTITTVTSNCNVVGALMNSGSVTSVVDTGGSAYTLKKTITNGAARLELWSTTFNGSVASSSVTVSFTGVTGAAAVGVSSYTGASGIGVNFNTNTGSSADPTVSQVTQDTTANWVIAALGDLSSTNITAKTGNLRTTSSMSGVGIAMNDNSGTASNVVNAVTLAANTWAAAVLELRRSITAGVQPNIIAPVLVNRAVWPDTSRRTF